MLLYDHLLTLPEEVRRFFPKFCVRIFTNPMFLGNRFTQYGRRRKRSVSLLSLHTRSSFRLTTFRPFSSLLVHSGTIAIP
jgi:hypothetical protein